jgi:hypothetical protein
MTRSATATAFLAAALAFGVGYAVRLACAWSAGPIRAVETEEVSGPQPRAQAESCGVPAATAESEPPPSTNAVDGAPPEAVRGGTNPAPPEDVFSRALYESFSRNGRAPEFRRIFDRAAVVPLGRNPEELGLLDAGATAPSPIVESVPDLRRRLACVNVGEGRPPMRPFQFAAFRRGARFEVVLGDAGLPSTLDPTSMARFYAARAGKAMPGTARDGRRDSELVPEKADALLAWCAESHRDKETARRALWSRLHDLATRGDAKPLDPREVVGVCVAGDRCVVVRVGDDPELDRLVDEADREERAARSDVEFELRR